MFESEKVSLKPLIIAAVSFVALTLVMTVALQSVGVERVQAWVASAGAFAPVAYIAIRIVTNVIAPISSGPFAFTAGILFGFWEGMLYALIGETIGGSINFMIARKLGRPVVLRFVGNDGMGKVERFYRQAEHPLTLIFARIFLFSIYDFISYAAGLTRISFRNYFVISAVIGIIPNVLSVSIGASMTGSMTDVLLMYGVLGVISVAMLLLYGRIRVWLKLDEIAVEKTPSP